jgi:Tfp pilus assembly protein PilF
VKNISKKAVALLVSLLALVTLALQVQSVPAAGRPAMLLAQKLGVDPFPSFSQPLYGWIVEGLAAISGAHAVYVINLFSAVCGALLLGVLFSLVYLITRYFNDTNILPHGAMHRVQMVAGLVASLYLLSTETFLRAATQAYPLTFDLLMVMVPFYLVLSFTGKSGVSRIMVACFLYGLAMVEFNTAILLLPLFGILIIVMLYTTDMIRPWLIARAAGCGLAGLSLYLVQAGVYMASEAYLWREFKGFFQVLWYIWLEQYQGLTRGVPRVGWLTMALVSVLPWVITTSFRLPVGAGKKAGALVGAVILNILLLVLGVMLALEFPLSPASVAGGGVTLYLTPYIFIALWLGNVMAFMMMLLFRKLRFERGLMVKGRPAMGYTLVMATAVFLLVIFFAQTRPALNPSTDRMIARYASALVDAAGDRAWLLSNTVMDDQIAIELSNRGSSMHLIRLNYGRSSAMMRYVATLFEGNPRLQSLARIGMEPLLDQWLGSTPGVVEGVAIVTAPDLWMAAGFEAVPENALFTGAAPDDDLPLDELMAEARAFWSGLGSELASVESGESISGLTLNWIKVHSSKVANNLGVLMDEQGRSADAFACYRQARVFAPDNLSALMNMHVLAQREELPEFEDLERELVKKTESLAGRVQPMLLAAIYGFVRVPELFVNRGLSFAMSGKAALAIRDMKRALSLSGDNPRLQLALAQLYFGQERDVESADYYARVLEKDPDNAGALLGMMRLAARRGNLDEARNYLQILKDTGAPALAVKVEEATLEAIDGSLALAMTLLQEVVQEEKDNLAAWSLLAVLSTQLNDTKTSEAAIKRLRDANVLSPAIQLVMAQAAMNKNDPAEARLILGELLRQRPGNIPALEMLLRIDLAEGARDDVQRTVERILNVDPANALANYMLGVYHYYREEHMLAESAYRASIATRRSAEALNDLAYVLHLQKRNDEAELLIRESLQMNEANPAAWDTLGVILMQAGQLVDAEAALQRSLMLRPENPNVMLNMALLLEQKGLTAEAARVVRDLNARLNDLSPVYQASLRALERRLGPQ